MVIIIVLKLDSRVNLKQRSGHELGLLLTRFNVRIKMIIIIVLKPNLRVDQGKSWVGGITWIDLNELKNKNDYYHSFKIQLGNRQKTRYRSRVGRVNSR
jgi:hypothetical protein